MGRRAHGPRDVTALRGHDCADQHDRRFRGFRVDATTVSLLTVDALVTVDVLPHGDLLVAFRSEDIHMRADDVRPNLHSIYGWRQY